MRLVTNIIKKWSKNLPNVNIIFEKYKEEDKFFNPTEWKEKYDCEKYFELLIDWKFKNKKSYLEEKPYFRFGLHRHIFFNFIIFLEPLSYCRYLNILGYREIIMKIMEFCSLDLNDKWISKCGSICCSENQNIRINYVMLHLCDMDITILIFKTFLIVTWTREKNCDFCKRCSECRRFRQLYYEY